MIDDGSDKPDGFQTDDGELEVRTVDGEKCYHETELGQHQRWMRQAPDLFGIYQVVIQQRQAVEQEREILQMQLMVNRELACKLEQERDAANALMERWRLNDEQWAIDLKARAEAAEARLTEIHRCVPQTRAGSEELTIEEYVGSLRYQLDTADARYKELDEERSELMQTTIRLRQQLIEQSNQLLGRVPATTNSDSNVRKAGWHNGQLYCYGGCGLCYQDFPRDMILPTALWNRIAVGPPFDETQTGVDREGRGGVLCPACIVQRLATLPECTAIFADIDDHRAERQGETLQQLKSQIDNRIGKEVHALNVLSMTQLREDIFKLIDRVQPPQTPEENA